MIGSIYERGTAESRGDSGTEFKPKSEDGVPAHVNGQRFAFSKKAAAIKLTS